MWESVGLNLERIIFLFVIYLEMPLYRDHEMQSTYTGPNKCFVLCLS